MVLTFGLNPAISRVIFLEFPPKITNFFEKYLQKGSRNETFLVAKRQADPNICEQTGSPRCWSPSGSGCRCTTLKLETFPAMALAEASCILAFEWVVFSIWSSVTNSNEIAAFQGLNRCLKIEIFDFLILISKKQRNDSFQGLFTFIKVIKFRCYYWLFIDIVD